MPLIWHFLSTPVFCVDLRSVLVVHLCVLDSDTSHIFLVYLLFFFFFSSFFFFVFFLMIRRPPRSTLDRSSAASDVYKRQVLTQRLLRQACNLRRVAYSHQRRCRQNHLCRNIPIQLSAPRNLLMGTLPSGHHSVLASIGFQILSLIHISEPTRPY